MPVITLITKIKASADVVFDLARSIDLHKMSTVQTREEAVAGKTSGLIGLGETVTWRARHFAISQKLTSRITEYKRPHSFTDEMVAGAFKSFRHDHIFKPEGDCTVMTDIFNYKSPLGFLGNLADTLFLKRYMKNLLARRNAVIKEYAEDPEKYAPVLFNA